MRKYDRYYAQCSKEVQGAIVGEASNKFCLAAAMAVAFGLIMLAW